jgi:hypothetical protein
MGMRRGLAKKPGRGEFFDGESGCRVFCVVEWKC